MELDFSQPAPRLDAMSLEDGQRLVDTLWELLRVQSERIKQLEALEPRIQELEERLNLNSQNSSRPPSSDFGANKRKPRKKRQPANQSKRSQGGQPGHQGISRKLLPSDRVDEFVDCTPQSRCGCGGTVHVDPTKFARHQLFELPVIRPLVTEFHLFSGTCFECGKPHSAKLPKDIVNGMFGPRMMAWIVIMSGIYQISRRKIQRLLEDLMGVSVSVGTISNTEERVSEALSQPVKEAANHIRQASHVNLDETGHKQAGKPGWMWVSVTSLITVFWIRMSRASKVAKEILGETFSGVLTSDRYSSYNWVNPSQRQLCWAHLIRDFRRISSRSGKAGHIGDELLYQTNRMFRLLNRVRNGTLSREKFILWVKPFQNDIEAALTKGTSCDERKTEGTCKKLLGIKQAMWTFVTDPDVEPTNNAAERALRPYVIWRKRSFGAQSDRGNRFIERILTVAASCDQQDRDVMDFLTTAIQCHAAGLSAPSLLSR